MSKYIRYKFENAGTKQISNENVDEPRNSRDSNCEERPDKKLKLAVQPPLPPNSPPPDCPATFVFKQEIEDDGYEDSSLVKSEEMENDTKLEYEKNKPLDEKPQEKTKKTMCKDFIRGICKRGDSCIYAHEVDISQLSGVYKFCRDYENRKCKRPRCFFVHATTSEKEHFFRTAELPEHTLSHLREANVLGGPSMPSVSTMSSGIQPVYGNTNNPPPNSDVNQQMSSEVRSSDVPVLPVVPATVAPVNVNNRMHPDIFQATQAVSPTRREWPEFSGVNVNVSKETPGPAHGPKPCVSCELKKSTLIKNTNQLKEIEESLSKWKETAAVVERKKEQLIALLTMMLLKNLSKNNIFLQNICD